MLWHSACWGCAGISRQLHPLKVKDPMKDRVIKIKEENDVRINIIMFTSIWSSWAREFNHSIIVQVSTPRVCYNQSSTAYLEGRRWEIGIGWGKNVFLGDYAITCILLYIFISLHFDKMGCVSVHNSVYLSVGLSVSLSARMCIKTGRNQRAF